MSCHNCNDSMRVAKYGREEIALRHRIDRLSLMVSAARPLVRDGELADTVIRLTYPSILDGVGAMDKRRASAKRWRGAMTEYCLGENEAAARLLSLHADVCADVLRSVIRRAA